MSNMITTLKTSCEKVSSSLNIKKYDLYGIIKQENNASSKDKKPFALNASFKNTVTLRVWNEKNQVGVTSTSNLTEEGILTAFKMAKSSAEFSTTIEYEFSSLCQEKITQYSQGNADFESIQKLSQAAIECEASIFNSLSSIKSLPYNKVSQSFFERFYFNSLNAHRTESISSSYCYFYPLAQEENKIPRQLGHIVLAQAFNQLNYLECAQIAVEKTKKHLNYKKIASGNYTVVFSPEAFLDLIGAFSNFFNAQNVIDNKSLSSKKSLNQKICSSLLNIIDDPLNNNHIGKISFDEEGTPTSELSIIENGVLKNFIHTSYTAKVFNKTPTGHASLGSKLTASSHFLKIFSKENTENKFNHSNYIYIENVKALHAGINALQGSFSLPLDGFIIENNEQISIESATVAGDFLTLLQNIVYISPEQKVTPSGICSDIWVESLSITSS